MVIKKIDGTTLDAYSLDGRVYSAFALKSDLVVKIDTVEISNAELLALFTTAKLLVAAPGAHKILHLLSCLLITDAGDTAFTIGTAGTLVVKYTDKNGQIASVTIASSQAFESGVDETTFLTGVTTGSAIEASLTENQPLVLALLTANMTDGNGVARVKVIYVVHDTGLS